MNVQDDDLSKERIAIEVQKLQDEALKRARNLRKRSISIQKKSQ